MGADSEGVAAPGGRANEWTFTGQLISYGTVEVVRIV